MAITAGLAIIACKDDFNEQDFIQQQLQARKAMYDSASEQAVKEYINAVNEAGDLLSLNLMVRENGIPVQGVTVSLTTSTANAISSGRTKAVQTGITDATGNVMFEKVVIGSGTISFQKTGYVGSTATVDFGQPDDPMAIPVTNPITGVTVNRYVPPTKRFEEALIPMYSASAGGKSTATITGKVVIENNVTNLAQEVPTGITIRANLVGLMNLPANTFISNFAFEDNAGLGVATVAQDGTYTMTVPATAAGLPINLIIPNIEGTVRMAVNGYDNGTGQAVPLPAPEYRDVPTTWGPQAPLSFGNTIPAVAGAKLVFSVPPAAGSGLTFDYTPVARSLGAGTCSTQEVVELGNTFYRIISRGNYSSGAVPTISITGGGGQGAVFNAIMRTYVSSITVTNVGVGYSPGSLLLLNLVRVRSDDTEEVLSSINALVTQAGTLPATINLAPFNNTPGFKPFNQQTIASGTKSLKMTVTKQNVNDPGSNAAITGVFNTELFGFNVANGGSGYTSKPQLILSGGGLVDGSNLHASIEVVSLPVHWTVVPNNTNTSDYPLIPALSITYPPSPLAVIPSETDVEAWSLSGTFESTSPLSSRLMISAGDVVVREPNRILRTVTRSGSPPTIIVTTEIPSNAKHTLTADNINAAGEIESIPNTNRGNGYDSPMTVSVQPTVTGAPGSGASILLANSFDISTGEYSWTGVYTITNKGTGYLRNLNRKGAENGVFPSTITAQAGKTYTADINYGTGNRKLNVN